MFYDWLAGEVFLILPTRGEGERVRPGPEDGVGGEDARGRGRA
jgi:hypothetical protein